MASFRQSSSSSSSSWVSFSAAFWLALLAPSLRLAAEASPSGTCFFPDGSISSADSPCTNDEVTHCCNSLNACLSNGYCMSLEQTPYVISRGSCTDADWGDGCPQECKTNNPSGGYPISWLGKGSSGQEYCCGTLASVNGSVSCDSDTTDGPFTMTKASLVFDAGILAGITNTTASNTTAGNTTDTGSGSSSSNATTCTDASGNGDNSSSGPSVTAVGAGVGVSLGVVAVTAVAWALYERRKRVQLLRALAQQSQETAMSYAGGPGGGPGGPGGAQTAAYYSPQPQYVSGGGGGGGGIASNGSSPNDAAFKMSEHNPLAELAAAPHQQELSAHGAR